MVGDNIMNNFTKMLTGKSIIMMAALGIAILIPFLFTNDYQREILVLICIFSIIGLSLDIIMGQMGQFSFGHAAVFGLGAYTSAILVTRYGISVWLGILCAIILTTIVGFLLGYVALRRTRAMELAIITFALGAIMLAVAQSWHSLTGGMTGLHRIPAPPFDIHAGGLALKSEFAFYWLALTVLVLSMYGVHRFMNSKIGRAVRSIRENEDLANSVGISPTYYYVIAFTVATGLGGLAGALYGHHVNFVNAGMLRLDFMIIMLMVVLVGGSGTLGGPIIGSSIYWVISEQLRSVSDEYRLLIFGAILLVVILFLPKGVFPALQSVFERIVYDKVLTDAEWRSRTWKRIVFERAWLSRFKLRH